MNSSLTFSQPPVAQGSCGEWTYHEWTEALSTNDLARQLPPWHIAVCGKQTAGRGRFNREWFGAEGGLWLSFTVPLSSNRAGVNPGHLPLVAGVALFRLLQQLGVDRARLRWPNDLLAGNAKLAGILVERPQPTMAVIGIGMNVFNNVADIAPLLKDPPVRLQDLVAPPCPDLKTLMHELGVQLYDVFTLFEKHRLVALQDTLARAWAGERPVRIETDTEHIIGTFNGIDAEGNPIITVQGQTPRIVPAYSVTRLIELSTQPD